MENGLENYYIIKNNKKLHYGYTTGSCAAAAAKAAVYMLLGGRKIERVDLRTPKGILLHLSIQDIHMEPSRVSCAVQKDGGDDPDATHGLLIYAEVTLTETPGVHVDGGKGVGRVTKKGLEQPVGAAAINKVPRAMIEGAVREAAEEFEYQGGFSVVISVPKGEETARKTFNPRLGIQGGISILGTSGIVVPMSEEALIASIGAEMSMKKENGNDYLLITPGNYGEAFLREYHDLDVENSMKCSNYVGETLDFAVNLGIKGILFVAHIGKFIKVSGGIMNTHSRSADSRAELMAAAAIRAGASLSLAKEILATITTEEAVGILKRNHLLTETMSEIIPRVHGYLQHRCGAALETEVILYSNEHGWLGQTQGANKMLHYFERQCRERSDKKKLKAGGRGCGTPSPQKTGAFSHSEIRTEKEKPAMKGTLYGVGIGPGDPELLTLKAVRLIRETKVIAVPGEKAEETVAYQITEKAVPELKEKELLALSMPMTKDKETLDQNYEKASRRVAEYLEKGENVVFLTLGDPTVYSTYLYVHQRILDMGYEAQIVSGITSFCAVSARLNEGLVERSEPLHVIPASYQIEEALTLPGTKVLMKAGKKMKQVKEQLKALGETAVMIENCGMPGEKIYRSVEEIPEDAGYYSLIIVKEKKDK